MAVLLCHSGLIEALHSSSVPLTTPPGAPPCAATILYSPLSWHHQIATAQAKFESTPLPSHTIHHCPCITLYTIYHPPPPTHLPSPPLPSPSQSRLRLNLLPPPLPRRPLLILRHHTLPHRTRIQLFPHPVRQRQNARTHRCAIAAVFPGNLSACVTLLAAEVKDEKGAGVGAGAGIMLTLLVWTGRSSP